MAILRTNYRKTGGLVDAIAVAGHLMSTCCFGDSVGIKLAQYPNAGFIKVSVIGEIQGQEVTAGMLDGGSLAGISQAWCESTYGILSKWGGNPVSGYRFMPIGFRFLSFSGVNTNISAGHASGPFGHLIHVSYFSGSCFEASIAVEYPISGGSISLRGTADFRGEVWGFIISAP